MDQRVECLDENEQQLTLAGKAPWNPADFIWIAILFSFGAVGILAGLNWRRLGKPHRARPIILLSIGGILLTSTALALFPANTLNWLLVYALNIGIGLVPTLMQLSTYKEWETKYGKPSRKESGYAIPIGVGLSTIAATLLLTYLVALVANPLLSVNRAIDHYNKGVDYVQHDRLDSAIEEFTRAIKLNPQFAEAYSNRGNAYLQKGDFGQAISDCNRAIELNPQDRVAFFTRGVAYLAMEFHDLALEDLNKAIELTNDDPAAYYFRGWVYVGIGNHDSAVQDLQQALELDPYPELRRDIEALLGELGKY